MDFNSEIERIDLTVTSKVRKIFEMFLIYYGEENVELDLHSEAERTKEKLSNEQLGENPEQVITDILVSLYSLNRPAITIHWPEIEITNENGCKETIYDLFCNVSIAIDGNLSDISFRKTTFTESQLASGYIHSHLTTLTGKKRSAIINAVNCRRAFCFGSAPINNTIRTLNCASEARMEDNDLYAMYMLLCRELDVCVHIESLAGVPYIKMSSIGQVDTKYEKQHLSELFNDILDSFTKGFIRNFIETSNLRYVYDGKYSIAFSFDDFALRVTKAFLAYVKDNKSSLSDLSEYMSSMIYHVIRKNGHMFYKGTTLDVETVVDLRCNKAKILSFNGKDYFLEIVKDRTENDNGHGILRPDIVSYIFELITAIINSPTEPIEKLRIEIDNERREQNKSGNEGACNDHKEMRYEFLI